MISSNSVMEWTDVQRQDLYHFLAGFTCPDPQVQASNLQQLDALAQYPHALVAVCGIVCDGSIPSTIRLSATTVARQLLQCPERLVFYLGPNPTETTSQVSLQPLMSGLLDTSYQPISPTYPAPLRRATTSLIATLLKAAAMDRALFSAAAAAWDHLLMFLLDATADLSASAGLGEGVGSTCLESGAQIAALLRELCETALASSHPLREWVGGQLAQCTSLCTLFSQLLHHLQPFLRALLLPNMSGCAQKRELAMWMENLLAAFSSCLDSGVFPSTTPDVIDGINAASGDGPAMQALREVCSAVTQIHASIQEVTLHLVLGQFALRNDGNTLFQADASLNANQQPLLACTAPFVAITMRYMTEAVPVEPFDALNCSFQRVAVPLLESFCCIAAHAQLVYDGAGDSNSTHAAVVACVNYVAQLVHVEHSLGLPPGNSSGGARSMSESGVACVHRMLICAAALPVFIAEQLSEHTVHEPDSAEEMLVKSVSARRRNRRGAPSTNSAVSRNELGAARDEDEDDGNADGDGEDAESFALADAVEAQLPDNGTLRQAVAWAANSLTCREEWAAALLPLVVAPSLLRASTTLYDACATEAALFVCNEMLDALLADKSMCDAAVAGDAAGIAISEQLAAQLRGVLPLLPSFSSASPTAAHAPSFLRVQAVRFLGRLGSGLMEWWRIPAWGEVGHAGDRPQAVALCTHTVLTSAGGLEGLLWTLAQTLTSEVNKAVQVECVRVVTVLTRDCLRTFESLIRIAEHRTATGDSELEEESLDGDDGSSCSGGDHNGGCCLGAAQCPDADTAKACVHLFRQALGISPGLVVFPQTLQLLHEKFPNLQWSVRQSMYHLFSETLPPLWALAHGQTELLWGCDGDAAAAASTRTFIRVVTAQSLEVLAAHYMSLLADARTSLFEMATLLSCMADVATAMDSEALESVLPWILQVTHHVLNAYADYLACRNCSGGSSTTSSSCHSSLDASVDMTDMCMVSLDLISCVCDGLVDRDALLACQLDPQRQEEAVAMDRRVMALATALLHPALAAAAATSNASPPGVAPGTDALANRCVALLTLCQSLPDHPSRVTTAARAHTEDEFGEIRRACFAVLYDCIFLLCYAESLFRPHTAQPSTTSDGCGLSDVLLKDVLELCLCEVAPCVASLSTSGKAGWKKEGLVEVSMHSVAASDAWLCLGAVLTLWDQQRCGRRKGDFRDVPPRASSEVHTAGFSRASGPAFLCATAAAAAAAPHTAQPWRGLASILDSLLTLLINKKFVADSYWQLNMTSAACGLAALLAGCPSPITPTTQQTGISYQTLDAVFSVASSARIREYAADATSGDPQGLSEAAQVLWCLGRVWQDAVQPLPHDSLRLLLGARGKDVAKTAAWLLRCITVHAKSTSLLGSPFWLTLVELWRPLAQTLLQAEQAGVFAASAVQSSALRQLAQL